MKSACPCRPNWCDTGGSIVEKGATSTTIVSGALSETRAKAMSARNRSGAEAGSLYSAAALSLVLHSAHPFIPTLRGDIRVLSSPDSDLM